MVKSFYICPVCKKLVQVEEEAGGKLFCCGKLMEEVKANSTDAAVEKHVPEVTVEGSKISVAVGSVAHPMTEEHLITWIYLDTQNGGQFHYLKANEEPKAQFMLAEGDKANAVYAYCNLHGLWVKEL